MYLDSKAGRLSQSDPRGCELSPVAAEVHYLSSFIELHFTYLADLKGVITSELTKTNPLCEIESSELKGKLQDSLWAYLKVLIYQAGGVP